MRRVFWGLFALLTFSAAACAAEVTPLPLVGPNAPAVVLWNSEQSLSDGPLADPRLEQPVRFWRAGLSMEEVAAGIREQTGVEVRFWPPEGVERRLRVNLYLNPKAPPALRDVLVQLGWVLGCNFACTEGEPRVYYLLGTEMGRGVVEAMAREQEDESRGHRRSLADEFAAVSARLQAYRGLLSLSREEVVARYADTDKRIALDLLDPRRRAAIQLLLSLPLAELEGLPSVRWKGKAPSDLTPEQRALAAAAVGVERLPEGCIVDIGGNWYGFRVRVRARRMPGEEEETYLGKGPAGMGAAPDSRYYLLPPDEVELRRLLGEQMRDEEAEKQVQEAWQRRQAESESPHLDPEEARARWLAEPGLSPEAREALTSTSLTWDPSQEYALWQVQEAVAALTGRHVVSDCFFQPRDSLRWDQVAQLDLDFRAEDEGRQQRLQKWLEPYGGGFDPDGAPEETQREYEALSRPSPRPVALLYWLLVLCQHTARRPLHEVAYFPLGWEWGDAGEFLHFRTVYPELVRGAFLPEGALAEMQALESPSLDTVDFSAPPAAVISMALAPQADAGLVRPLTPVQWQLGPNLIYEDPGTPLAAARARARAILTGNLMEAGVILPVLTSLAPKQWEKLGRAGLNGERDLTPEQQALLKTQGLLGDRPLSAVRLVASHPPPEETELPPTAITRVAVRIEGSEGNEDMGWMFGRYGVPLQKPLPHLVPRPQ